jgi:hypothetical protein
MLINIGHQYVSLLIFDIYECFCIYRKAFKRLHSHKFLPELIVLLEDLAIFLKKSSFPVTV